MEQAVYSKDGKEVSKVKLPEGVFGLPWNADLVHQVVTSMLSDARTSIAHTKDRSEVRGGGRKPWRQKGTGRARHGSRRSPIWIGGGVTFGPRSDKDYSRKVNKKMKTKALYTILSQKARDGEVILVENFAFPEPKTADAKKLISAVAKGSGHEDLATKVKNAAYIATDDLDQEAKRSFDNFGNIKVDEVRNINPIDLLNYKYVVIENPEVSVKKIEERSVVKTNKK
jgi:large subunit ribosomal protein L4